MKRWLIAGLGNVFKGDDAFGVEVVKRLADRAWPTQVDVVDFGINGIDLIYALLDQYDAAVLIDTYQHAGAPGTLYVIEPELPVAGEGLDPLDLMLNPHELDPTKVLRMVAAMDGRCHRIVLVGCEPGDFGGEWEGRMGLTDPVVAAVDAAVSVVDSLIDEWLAGHPGTSTQKSIVPGLTIAAPQRAGDAT